MRVNSIQNSNTSFKALTVKGGTPIIQDLIKADTSLQDFTESVKSKYNKDLLVSLSHKKYHERATYKPFLSIDKGKIGNFLTQIGLGKKVMLCHHHSECGLEQRCNQGLLKYRNVNLDRLVEKLGLK